MNAHRLTTTAGTLLAAAALAAPAAAQSGGQDLRSPDARDAAVAATHKQDLRSPDARDAATAGAAAPMQDLRSPDARDAAQPVRPVVVQIPPARADAGFAWDSAAIGALAGAGLLISITGGAVLLMRRRPHTTPVA